MLIRCAEIVYPIAAGVPVERECIHSWTHHLLQQQYLYIVMEASFILSVETAFQFVSVSNVSLTCVVQDPAGPSRIYIRTSPRLDGYSSTIVSDFSTFHVTHARTSVG